jgi:hypothetical protein
MKQKENADIGEQVHSCGSRKMSMIKKPLSPTMASEHDMNNGGQRQTPAIKIA